MSASGDRFADLGLTGGYALDLASLTPKELGLWQALLADYRELLTHANGGQLRGGRTYFTVPMERAIHGEVFQSTTCNLDELWGFIGYRQEPKPGLPSILHEHIDRHVEEDFLPGEVLVIGRTIQNSLLCLSLNESDPGGIYYWEWYWRYPWFQGFFDRRIAAAKAPFKDLPDYQAICDDPDHPRYAELADALNFATLVKVADSFGGFVAGLTADT